MFSLLLPFTLLWVAVSSELLSRGKPTVQSSIYPGRSWGADKAVDGNYDWDVAKGFCFHSSIIRNTYPYMIVDLQGKFEIKNIIIYNRGDCCSERIIGITVDLLSKSNQVMSSCGKITSNQKVIDMSCGNRLAEKIGIMGNQYMYLQICELEVHGDRPLSLLSRGKDTSHSSTYNEMGSPLAVDGRYDNFVDSETETDLKNCFVSDYEVMPHFVVDLKGTFQIERIVIYNREDCCSERMINVVVELLYANGEMSHECTKITEDLPVYNISCGNNVAQKVRIVGAQNDHMQLCEVDVFGKPHTLPQLISRNKPTTESSAMGPLNASLVVDGNYRTFINLPFDVSLKNCFHTSGDEVGFMEVDLQGKFNVDYIVLHNRVDCCSERMIGATVDLLGGNGKVTHTCGKITDKQIMYKISCGKNPAHKVRVTAAEKGIMHFCELDVFGVSGLTIISRGKPTTSSSVYDGLEGAYAVDGIYEYDPHGEDGANLFHSDEDDQPFWVVDLQAKFNIDNVLLYNRMDCCMERMVDTVIELLTETGEVSYECTKITDVKAVYKIPCGNNVASKVRVRGPPKQYLHFSEVVVYGELSE